MKSSLLWGFISDFVFLGNYVLCLSAPLSGLADGVLSWRSTLFTSSPDPSLLVTWEKVSKP